MALGDQISKSNSDQNLKTILIIDDDLTLCRSLRESLKEHGFSSGYIIDPKLLLEKLDSATYDLILVDLFMPDMDGFEVIKIIRNHEKWDTLPVLAMTSDTSDELIDRCFSEGFNDFIFKPPQMKPLIARMNASLNIANIMQKRKDEVELANKKLKEFLIRSEEESRNKGLFLGIMSHELRTPLNGMVAAIDLLADDSDGELNEDLYGLLQRSSQRMQETVTSVLDYANLESLNYTCQMLEFVLRDRIAECTKKMAQKYASKEIDLELHVDKHVPKILVGDGTRLAQVMTVLLDNAYKFTKEGMVSLIVNLVSENEVGLTCRFEVVDTGVGFDELNSEMLFNSFVQVDQSLTRSFEGSGLGLSIAKRCCDILKSELQYSSEVGKGSHFWFETEFKKTSSYKSPSQIITE
jgi:signal transduction histidine kinase